MAPWRALTSILRRRSTRDWQRPFPESKQSLRIDAAVLRHIRRYRQSRNTLPESGGQLFGTVTDELVTVSQVAGPHRDDERARFAFRSNPHSAQAGIEHFAKQGLLYLGEWHTHAEALPSPSLSDEHAMRQIFSKSQLNTAALLLIILGFAQPDDDVGIWYIDASGTLRPMV